MNKILITGAASGLGKAIAELYADLGWLILVVDIQDDVGNEFVNTLNEQGKNAEYYHCDIGQQQSFDDLFLQVSNKHSHLDVLVNNAGVASAGTLESTTPEEWDRLIRLDLMSVIHGTKALLPLLKKSPKAHIVSTASYAGIAQFPGMMSYNVAKGAVVAFSETLHGEMSLYNIGVSVLCPEFFQTNLTNSMTDSSTQSKKFVEAQMQQSGVTAQDVAQDVVKAIKNNTFMVISHKQPRRQYLLKRLFPNFFMQQKIKIFKKLMAKIKKYNA